jgi:hypothetical protein
VALEEEAALGLGSFFWLSWQAFLYLDWCWLLMLLHMGGLADTPLVDLIAMGQRLGFSTVVVVRVVKLGKSLNCCSGLVQQQQA